MSFFTVGSKQTNFGRHVYHQEQEQYQEHSDDITMETHAMILNIRLIFTLAILSSYNNRYMNESIIFYMGQMLLDYSN